jgi:methylated-DNA-[protein]-cysteine S-methyltransferase
MINQNADAKRPPAAAASRVDTPEPQLIPVAATDTPTLERLHQRLVEAAAADGSLDVAYRTFDSPLGLLLLAATEQGLVRLAYEREDHDQVLQMLAALVSPRILRATGRLDETARQLDAYFAGTRQAFDVPVDLRLSTGFRRQVLDHLRTIGYGDTESYTVVAAAAGRPRAVRAVGSACATNPVPVVVPCHRVLRSDGTLGGYIGGLGAKRTLLDLERYVSL